MSAAYPLQPAAQSEPKSATFGTASAVLAGLTVLLPVVIIAFFVNQAQNEPNEKAAPWAWLGVVLVGGALSIIGAGLTSVAGTVSGAVALARGERRSWLAAIGLLVNVPVTLFALYVVAVTIYNRGG